MSAAPVRVEDLKFGWGGEPDLLRISEFELAAGERLFLRGPSGSGKSTLLGLIAGVLTARSGRVTVLGQDMARLSAAKRDQLRADHLGVIFQMFNLLPYLSVTANVTLPCRFSKRRRQRIGGDLKGEAERLLARLGLDDPELLKRRALDLSVGQQQRVAAARALIGAPDILIADEPTSALDADARDQFISLLVEEAHQSNACLLFVSHDAALGEHFDRVLDLRELNTASTSREAA